MTKDKVIFRKYTEGDIIAFFPDDKYNDKFIWSYQHVGQHSGASPELIDELQLATPEEYKDLLNELIALCGYDVEVCNE